MDGIKSNKNLKKNSMKNIFKISLAILSFTIISCQQEENEEGKDARDEFTGNWLVLENGQQQGIRSFEANIVKSVTSTEEINISNFYKLGDEDTVVAKISTVEATTFIIPIQTVSGHFINGTGALSGDEIEMVYYVNDGFAIDTLSATFTRDIE